MTSSDTYKTDRSILDESQVSIGDLVKENISVTTRLALADQEHKNNQEALDKEHKRTEEAAQGNYKRRIDTGTNIFIALFVAIMGIFCINIILNPKAPNELTKWACGLLGTFAGASVGLIRRS